MAFQQSGSKLCAAGEGGLLPNEHLPRHAGVHNVEGMKGLEKKKKKVLSVVL